MTCLTFSNELYWAADEGADGTGTRASGTTEWAGKEQADTRWTHSVVQQTPEFEVRGESQSEILKSQEFKDSPDLGCNLLCSKMPTIFYYLSI